MSEFGALAHSLVDGDVSTVMSWRAIETWDTAQLCTVNWWCGSFLPPFCQNITLIHTFNCYLPQLFHYWFNYYIICMTVIPRIFLGRTELEIPFFFFLFFFFFFFFLVSLLLQPLLWISSDAHTHIPVELSLGRHLWRLLGPCFVLKPVIPTPFRKNKLIYLECPGID